MLPESARITATLEQWRKGDPFAREQFVSLVYDELRNLAAGYLRSERGNHTLQPTAVVHELYLRLFATTQVNWQNRAHVFAVAAQTLRRILVDHARAERAKKRGGSRLKLTLTGIGKHLLCDSPDEDLLAVNNALDRLSELAPRAAQVVELRFFGGLEENEVAEVLGVAAITVKRDWRFARAWLVAHFKSSS